jgi:hypothetical protein
MAFAIAISFPDASSGKSPSAVTGAKLHIVIVLLSNVTAPVCAKAEPQLIVAPVFKVMLSSARMFPTNSLSVPSVAEVPTCQNTLLSSAPLISKMLE